MVGGTLAADNEPSSSGKTTCQARTRDVCRVFMDPVTAERPPRVLRFWAALKARQRPPPGPTLCVRDNHGAAATIVVACLPEGSYLAPLPEGLCLNGCLGKAVWIATGMAREGMHSNEFEKSPPVDGTARLFGLSGRRLH